MTEPGQRGTEVSATGPQHVAVVIAARNQRSALAATVRACRAIPGVDLIVVVDDGSDDDTGSVARLAGAAVVRHSVPRGLASALETGVKVVAMRDRADWPARNILFLEPDLGDSAVEATPLVEAVGAGEASCAIGVPVGASRLASVRKARAAAREIRRRTGELPLDASATNRCITREALIRIMPFHGVSAVYVAMTLDLIAQGFKVVEIPCAFDQGNDSKRSSRRRGPRRADVWVAVKTRQLRRWRRAFKR
mgnify:CR=1 FL=1